MKKVLKRKIPSVAEQTEVEHVDVEQAGTDIRNLVDKIQQQLASLERKIDILINRPSERPFEGKHFSKPFQRFDNSSRHDRGRQGSDYRERSFTKAVCAECNKECEVPFKPSGDRPVYCKECFSKRKPDDSFHGRRDNNDSFRGRRDNNEPFYGRRDNRPREGGFVREHRQDAENAKPGKRKPALRRRK
jgi:CxxC-x17-CxxC domain-containing protein